MFNSEKGINVVFVDWSAGAKTFPDYDRARQNTFLVAEVTTKLLDHLKEKFDVNYDQYTIVGFSLGGESIS